MSFQIVVCLASGRDERAQLGGSSAREPSFKLVVGGAQDGFGSRGGGGGGGGGQGALTWLSTERIAATPILFEDRILCLSAAPFEWMGHQASERPITIRYSKGLVVLRERSSALIGQSDSNNGSSNSNHNNDDNQKRAGSEPLERSKCSRWNSNDIHPLPPSLRLITSQGTPSQQQVALAATRMR